MTEFYRFDEALEILREKYDFTRDELEIMARNSLDVVYMNDFPGVDPLSKQGPEKQKFYNPELCFFKKEDIDAFVPTSGLRLIYNHSLTKRNWSSDPATRQGILLQAGNAGLLQWYDKSKHDFSYTKHFTIGGDVEVIWSQTADGRAYAENPNSFFMLYEILQVERVLLGRSREECLKELAQEAQSK